MQRPWRSCTARHGGGRPSAKVFAFRVYLHVQGAQGYLAHKKPPPPHLQGPTDATPVAQLHSATRGRALVKKAFHQRMFQAMQNYRHLKVIPSSSSSSLLLSSLELSDTKVYEP